MSGQFELVGAGAAAVVFDTLGLWAPVESGSSPGFGQSPASDEPLLWRVRLADDRAGASGQLAQAADQLGAGNRALSDAERRLGFSAIQTAGQGQAERIVARSAAGWCERLAAARRDLTEMWAELGRGCWSFFRGIGDTLRRAGWVQTFLNRRRVGWSVVTLARGRVDTVLRSGLANWQVHVHQRAIELALFSRAALVRLFGLVLRAAAAVPALAATPAAPILALIVGWRLVFDVMGEVRWFKTRLQAARQSTPSL
jgi:hypothetical protein